MSFICTNEIVNHQKQPPMRYKTSKLAPLAATLFLSGFIILFPFFTSRAQKVKKETPKAQTDSPVNKTIVINDGDLDKAMNELNNINFDNIGHTVEAALAAVNFDAIGKSIEASMKAVNADSIRLQVEAALKSVDMAKIQVDIDKAMVELKNQDWKKELEKGMQEMQAGLKEMQKVNFAEIQAEIAKAQKEIAKVDMKAAMADAQKELNKAKKELTQLKSLLDEMKKDGLIDNTKSLRIEWKGNRLYINGKEQNEAVSEKYKALKKIEFSNDDDNKNNNDNDDVEL